MEVTNSSFIMKEVGTSNLYPSSTLEKGLTLFALLFLSCCATFGNILVFVAFMKVRSLQKTTNYLILSVAAADLIVAFVVINVYAMYVVMEEWPFSTLRYVYCVMWLSVDYSSFQASVISVLLVTGDQYLLIKYPHSYRIKRTNKKVMYSIVLSWIVSFVIWTPLIITYAYIDNRRELSIRTKTCDVGFKHNVFLTIFECSISYVIPLIIIGFSAIHSMHLLLNQKRWKNTKVHNQPNNDKKNSSVIRVQNNIVTPIDDLNNEQTNGRSLRNALDGNLPGRSNDHLEVYSPPFGSVPIHNNEKRKVFSVCENSPITKQGSTGDEIMNKSRYVKFSLPTYEMTVMSKRDGKFSKLRNLKMNRFERVATFKMIIAIAFIVNVCPFATISIARSLCDTCITKSWWHFGYIMSYLNTFVNPLCYAFGNKKFKKAFRTVLSCKR